MNTKTGTTAHHHIKRQNKTGGGEFKHNRSFKKQYSPEPLKQVTFVDIQQRLKAEMGVVIPKTQSFCPALVTGHHINNPDN